MTSGNQTSVSASLARGGVQTTGPTHPHSLSCHVSKSAANLRLVEELNKNTRIFQGTELDN